MAFRWWADDGPALNAGSLALALQGIRTSTAKKPYIFVIFQVGAGLDPLSHTLGPPMHNAACSISLVSTLFAKTKINFSERYAIIGIYNLCPLDITNGPLHVNSINQEERVH